MCVNYDHGLARKIDRARQNTVRVHDCGSDFGKSLDQYNYYYMVHDVGRVAWMVQNRNSCSRCSV